MASCVPQTGVTVRTDDGTRVSVEMYSDNIAHVRVVPLGEKFSTRRSLSALPPKADVDFHVDDLEDCVCLSTDKLEVRISKSDGRISYYSADGELISAEDSRSFQRIEVEGQKGWTVRQVFATSDDEGFYGLGQHQADEWNYRGKNEELYQYNTKISVPFVVSSKGYGILWDSYSLCRWGDPRDYAPLNEVFTLTDKNGEAGALTGTYTPASGDVLVRREPALCQEYLITPDCEKVNGAPDFDFSGSKVLYEGTMEPSESGVYRFLLYYAGYTKVFVDGEEVVPEIWRTAWNPNSHKFSLEMTAGKPADLRIEWIPDGSVSYCGLRVLSPVPEEEQTKMSWWGEMQQQIDYYFVAGESMDDAISGYRTITGKAQIMPKWAMGYWQCRERYRTQDELLQALKEMRERHIPVDNIVQDWQYWEDDKWGSHEFDLTRYPDPKGMVDSIHAMNAHFMISVWPKFYPGTEHFDELNDRGWIYQTALRDSVEDWLGYQQSFYDAYADGARKLFWKQMDEHLFTLGVDAWWMDASEPNIHDCTDMDYRKAMCGPTALGTSTEYFNAYALMNAQAIYDGQRGVAPDQRVFLLTRNGFAGLQRYSTSSWSGDIGTRWEDMKTQISAGLNFSLSGIPYWCQDIGGFSVENRYMAAAGKDDNDPDLREWRELQARWHEWGVYCPLYRSHGQWPNREFWYIAPEGSPAYEAMLATDRTRYELMPYIYTLASRTWFEDYTIMRALVMDWPEDAVAREISDEFMMGEALLVAPVYEYGVRSRKVYLPEGTWYEVHSGAVYASAGAWYDVPAPFEYCPVFAKGGSIIPHGPAIEYTSQPQDGSLDVYVYAGADAQFALYEDDGVSYGYERGECSSVPMLWNDSQKTFTVGARSGEFEGMFAEREIRVHLVSGSSPAAVVTIEYDGSCKEVRF
ncbi:MAG: DUF5110 domain-containing protein [Bacteroidales bacterium]|nr:DUF5110 domain-containing protein [Bacteroidales bacterium]